MALVGTPSFRRAGPGIIVAIGLLDTINTYTYTFCTKIKNDYYYYFPSTYLPDLCNTYRVIT